MKTHIPKEPDFKMVNAMDPMTCCGYYVEFFKACAEHTNRLNPVALSKVCSKLFHPPKDAAGHFGLTLSKAFSYAKSAGDKAVTGSRLNESVQEIYCTFAGSLDDKSGPAKTEAKAEISNTPKKKIKIEQPRTLTAVLSSPSQVLNLYVNAGMKVQLSITNPAEKYMNAP